MARITHTMLTRSMVSDVNDAAERLGRTQRKLSSGKEITRASDDPFAANRALVLRQDVERLKQQQRNVDEGLAWQSATDSALSKMSEIALRARELVVRGATDSASPVSREAIATEIDQLAEALKQEANTAYAGRFIFSVTATGTRPYAPGTADAYAGDAAAIARDIGPGVSVQVNVIGASVLGGGQAANDDRLLDVLRDVAQHLRGGTPADASALRGTDLQRLTANVDELSRIRAVVGATTNRLETAGERLAELEESSISLLSETEDADMAEAMTDFLMQQSVYQSALRSGANIIQASLMDFLR